MFDSSFCGEKILSDFYCFLQVTSYTYLLNYLLSYLLTYLLLHGAESLRTQQVFGSEEIPHILWKPKVHYRSHKCPPPVPILSHLYPVHTPTSLFLKIHLNIVLHSTPRSPKWSLFFSFPYQNPVYAYSLPHTRYMPRPSHSSRFYYRNNVG